VFFIQQFTLELLLLSLREKLSAPLVLMQKAAAAPAVPAAAIT
jgi:hypothetical protein